MLPGTAPALLRAVFGFWVLHVCAGLDDAETRGRGIPVSVMPLFSTRQAIKNRAVGRREKKASSQTGRQAKKRAGRQASRQAGRQAGRGRQAAMYVLM